MKDKYLRVGYICHSVFNVPRRKHTHTKSCKLCRDVPFKAQPRGGKRGEGRGGENVQEGGNDCLSHARPFASCGAGCAGKAQRTCNSATPRRRSSSSWRFKHGGAVCPYARDCFSFFNVPACQQWFRRGECSTHASWNHLFALVTAGR